MSKMTKHNRVPISQIKNKGNWEAGFDAGFSIWERGEKERKAGNIELAIDLFNQARNNGYIAPALYRSYAKAYRKLKDLDGEIETLEEGISRLKAAGLGEHDDLIKQLEKAKSKRK